MLRAPRVSCRSYIALEVANEVGMPLMAHIDHPPPSFEKGRLARSRPGDVLTHAFRPFPQYARHCARHGQEVVLEVRERGVLAIRN